MRSDFTKRFLRIESKLNLYNECYKGFNYWLYYRTEFYDRLNQKINAVGLGFTKNNSIPNLTRTLLRIMGTRYQIQKKLKKYNTLIIPHARRMLVDGTYMSIYTDYFANKLLDKIELEYPYNYEHVGLFQRKDSICLDRLFWIEKASSFIRRRINKEETESIRKILIKLEEVVEKEYGVVINVNEELDRIVNLYYRYKFMKKHFFKMLDIIQPHKIIEVVSYNFENMVLNELAHERNIPVIEMQHGLIGEDHIGYNYSASFKMHTFPDYLLVFGDYWKYRASYPIDKSHIISVGFPHFEIERQRRIIETTNEKYGILFISQGTVGIELSKVAFALSQIVDLSKFDIIYKLHPGEFLSWKNNYPQLVNSKVKVIQDEVDLYDLFCRCKLQIGVASTAVYEGLGFGLKTLIYNCSEAIHLMDLCEDQAALLVNNEQDIATVLANGTELLPDIGERFWKSNACNNIIEFLKSF